jgi:hypothetical protein
MVMGLLIIGKAGGVLWERDTAGLFILVRLARGSPETPFHGEPLFVAATCR